MKLYKLLFFKFYALFDFFESSTASVANAWLNTTIVLVMNFACFQYLCEIYFNKKLAYPTLSFLLSIFIGLCVYFKSVYKKQFLSYVTIFEQSSNKKKLFETIGIVLYCAMSIVCFFYLYNIHLLL
jgi:hypothetical protein